MSNLMKNMFFNNCMINLLLLIHTADSTRLHPAAGLSLLVQSNLWVEKDQILRQGQKRKFSKRMCLSNSVVITSTFK